MKKLDLYIIRKFLGTYIFMILAVMSIAIVIDISEKLRDFTDENNNITFSDIALGYYPYFFLHYVNLFSSLIIFLSVLFFTSFMAQRSEVIAILSNGVSFARFTRPYMMVSTLLLAIALLMNHLVVPHSNKKRLDFESKYITVLEGNFKKVTVVIDSNTIVRFNRINAKHNRVDRLWVEKWATNKDGVYELTSDMQVNSANGDSVLHNWELHNVFIRNIKEEGGEEIVRYDQVDTLLNFNTKDLAQRSNIMEAMNTQELIKFRNREKEKGSTLLTNIEIVLYERTAYPFATYILTLIGVAVSSRKSREGVGKNLIVGLIASVTYIFFMKMTTVASTNVGLAPWIAVWVPNIIFAFVALYLFMKRVKE
ncbi:MAG: LptF/LptG family permease [Flavobacteriales bacterium]|nr:LptF/LptG family permease [Flavobacteriales bacterium]